MAATSAETGSSRRGSGVTALFRRYGWAVLLAALGVPVLAGSKGCGRVVRDDASLRLTTFDAAQQQVVAFREMGRGATVEFKLRLDAPTASAPLVFDIAQAPDVQAIGEAPLPPGVTGFTVAEVSGTDLYARTITLSLSPNTPLAPLYVRAAVVYETATLLNYLFGIQPVLVHTGAGAPVVAGCIPSSGLRGTAVDVEIPASGIVGSVALSPADASFTVSGTTWDAAAGRVRATLQIADDARTGRTSFEVVNGDGVRSEPVDFTVLAGEPEPTVTGLYPNVLRIGRPVPTVLVAGSGFTTGLVVTSSAPAQAAPGTATLIDARTFALPWTFGPAATAASIGVTVETVGGVTSPSLLAVAPRDSTVPAITRIAPDRVATNTTTLLRIDSPDLGHRPPYRVVAIGSEAVPLPFVQAEVVAGSSAHDDFLVVRLVGTPGDPAVFGTPTGTVHLALEDADGFTSGAVPLRIDPRPAAPNPVIKSVTVGKVARGGEVVETIRGERLFDVERVYVESGGVELKRNVRIEDQFDGQAITVTLAATENAPLTGDAATNLVVVARRGRSNALAYRVEPASAGGDCGVTATSGVRLVATGASGYRVEITTADSAIDRSTQSGEVQIDHCTPAFDCFGLYVRTGAADLHVGSYTAVNVLYSDRFGSSWHKVDTPVRVVAEGASYVVFCFDNVLDGEGTNEDVTLTGYAVMSR